MGSNTRRTSQLGVYKLGENVAYHEMEIDASAKHQIIGIRPFALFTVWIMKEREGEPFV